MSGFVPAVFFTSGNVANVNALNIASTITGTFSLFFPQGDVLSGTILIPAGLLIPSLGQSTGATATITLTGGTGRFADATGSYPSFTISGTVISSGTATFQGSGSGTLSTPAFHVAGTMVYSGFMAHLASGGGWKTTIVLLNNGSASAQARLNFFDDHGIALPLPLTFPQGMPATTSNIFNATLQAGTEVILESQGPDATLSTGSAQLFSDGAVTGFLIFRYVPTGQEASVPLQTGNPGSYVLSFDATGGLNTGIAVANVAATTAAIPMVLRDDSGVVLVNDTVTLNAQGHLSFVVTDRYPNAVLGSGGPLCSKHLTAVRSAPSRSEPRGAAFTTIPASTK